VVVDTGTEAGPVRWGRKPLHPDLCGHLRRVV